MQCANRMPQLVAEIAQLKARIAQVECSNGGDRELALVLRQELVQLVKQQTLLMEARIARQTGGAPAGKAPAAPAGKARAASAKEVKGPSAASAAPAAPVGTKAMPTAVDMNDTAALDEFELVEMECAGKTTSEAKGQGKQQQRKANPAASTVAEQQVKDAPKQQVDEDKAARVAARQAQRAAMRQEKQAQRALRQGAQRAVAQAQPGPAGDDGALAAQRQAKRAARLQAASLLVAPAIKAAQANRAEWEALPTEGEQRFRVARTLAVTQLQNAHRLLREAFMQGLDSKPASGPAASAVPITTATAAAAGVGPIAA